MTFLGPSPDTVEKVLQHMLAPSRIGDAGGCVFLRLPDMQTVEMRIVWDIKPYFADPKSFAHDLTALLRPISEAISYGEVVDLRAKVVQLEKEAAAKDNEISNLKRYRDAVELLGGKR